VILASTIFVLAYLMIMWEKIHRTVVALFGAVLLILIGILSQEQAIEYIDFGTLGLLIGMMIIVGITRTTGVFEYMAIYAAKAAQGRPVQIMLYLSAMIGSANGLGFMDFVIALTPVIIVVYLANIMYLKFIYRYELVAREELSRNIMTLDEKSKITNPVLLKKCLWVIGLTILGFIIHQYLHIESATIAMAGATLLLLISGAEPEHALATVEWPVIFFFVGLFAMVGGLQEVGIIESIAKASLSLTGGALLPTGLLILWLSAILSAFVDNIPFVAAMIPLIQDMSRLGNIGDITPLWWCLSLGACLGGNGTLIGASANLVVAGMAEKRGIYISFLGFTKIAFPIMLLSIAICTVYLVIFYLS